MVRPIIRLPVKRLLKASKASASKRERLASRSLAASDRGGPLCSTPNLLAHDILAANVRPFDWPTFTRLAPPVPRPEPDRARFNATACQLRRAGHYTMGQICEAAGVSDSTLRGWEGVLIPRIPTVKGIRAVSEEDFKDIVARCRKLTVARGRRGWNLRRTNSALASGRGV
jgi:hypothetical protein